MCVNSNAAKLLEDLAQTLTAGEVIEQQGSLSVDDLNTRSALLSTFTVQARQLAVCGAVEGESLSMLPDAVRALIERLAGRIVAEEDAALEGKGVEEWLEDLEPELLVDFFLDYQTFIREARAIIKLQNREVGDAVA